MSVDGFVKHGYHYGLVLVKDGGMLGRIALHDIGEKGLVGAEYADGARQAQPMYWHKGVEAALRKPHRLGGAVRPKLKKETPLSNRPRLHT